METFHLMPKVVVKDNEGNTYPTYGEPVAFEGESWPGTGRVQAALYGEKLPYIRNVKVNGLYTKQMDESGNVEYLYESGLCIREKDGICIDVVQLEEMPEDGWPDPDYEIVAITPHVPLLLQCMRR